jgi:hypothetical protein
LLSSLKARFYRRILLGVLLFWVAAASFNGFYTKGAFLEERDSRRDFVAMIDGTAYRPFAYRNLLPFTANLVDRFTPQRFKDKIAATHNNANQEFYRVLFDSSEALNPSYSFRYFVFYIETFLCAWAATCLMYLVCRTEGIEPLASLAAAALMILVIPYFMVEGGGNFYDYSELAFLALSVWMARRFRWFWLIPVTVFAAWNKESFLLFVFTLYPLFRRRSSRCSALLGTGTLAAVSAGVYLLLRIHFAGNPGGTVENHFHDQMALFVHPVQLIAKIGKVYGILMPNVFTILPLALIVWVVWREWSALSVEIRNHARIAAAINIPLYFLFCNVGEIRDLSMLFMTLLLCLGLNFARESSKLSQEKPLIQDLSAAFPKQ